MTKKSIKLGALAFFSIALLSTPAWPVEEIIKPYRGIRSLGMGGIVTTTGRYDEALFSGNPATQIEDEKWKLTILSITAEVNNHIISDLQKLKDAKNESGAAMLSTIANSGLVGTNEHERVTMILPAFYSPNLFGENTSFAAGLLLNDQANFLLHNDAILDAQAFVDIGPSFGVAHRFLDGKLDVGLNVHVTYRVAGDPSFNATDFLGGDHPKLTASSIAGQGIGIDGDLGAYYKLPFEFPAIKTISVGGSLNSVAQSTYRIAGTTLIKNITTSPPNNDRTVSLGSRVDFSDWAFLHGSLFALEFQDIGTTRALASFWKKVHFGGETHVLKNLLAIRAGFNQGYIAGGIGLDLPLLKIDFATYGEELGATAGIMQDRRFALRLSFDI